jgi:hypothetical protein
MADLLNITDCPINEQGLPIQPNIEKDLMEAGFLDYFNKESACENEDECEQIFFETSTIQEIIPGEDCRSIYDAQGIPFPSTTRSLEESYGSTYAPFDVFSRRSLQRQRKRTRIKKRISGRSRDRRGGRRKKKKRRLLRASFDIHRGSMTLDNGHGNVKTYSLRTGSDGGVPENLRSLQVVPTVNIGDLTPDECANISIASSILEQDPDRPSFRTIVEAEEQEYVESLSCESGSEECDLPSGGYACCGVGQCVCDVGSETRCSAGTTFEDDTNVQCYLNVEGEQGDIDSRQDNLCCDVDAASLPLVYKYECSASVCGPLPTAECIQQSWTTAITQGPPAARRGIFRTQVTFDIFNICEDTLSNGRNVTSIIRSTIERYMKEILDESTCDGFIRVTDVAVNDIDTSRCTEAERCTNPTTGQQGPCVGVDSVIQGTFTK